MSEYQLSEFDVTAVGADMNLRYPEGMRSLVDANLALQGPATAPLVTGTRERQERQLGGQLRRVGRIVQRADRRRRRDPGDRGPGGRRIQRALRHPADRAGHAAHRQRPGARRRQRRPDDARHARSAADLRARGDRSRRGRVRRPALPGDARQPGFRERQPHPAVLRHRGGDARARAGADLPRHDAHGRHHRAHAAAVHVGSAAWRRSTS